MSDTYSNKGPRPDSSEPAAPEREDYHATSPSNGEQPEPVEEQPQGFQMPSMGELYVYLVALCCGVSMMMPVNAVFSAPLYIQNYYQYAMKDPDAVAVYTNFWDNSLTYYNLISMVTSLVMEPLTLMPSFRKIPMLPRLLTGLLILICEIILLMAVPAGGTSEGGAVATICCAGFIGGFGKSIFESTTYGMFGAFPPSYMSTMMGGVGISGALTSLIQVIVKGALGEGYENTIIQSKIYYGLDVGIQGITFIMLIMLRYNSFARNHFGDLGGGKSKLDIGNTDPQRLRELEAEEQRAAGQNAKNKDGNQPENDPIVQRDAKNSPTDIAAGDCPTTLAKASDSENQTPCLAGDSEGEIAPTSNQLLQATEIRTTLKKIVWMFITCGFNFFITLFLFPTIVVSADSTDYWYGTIAVLLFNVLDVFGRFTPSLRFMWPKSEKQKFIVVAASFARVIFVPLLLVYSYHYIPSHAFGYVMMVIFGYSNGYIGSMALVLGPQSKGISGDGQRFVAGTLMGISILIGGTIGSVLGIIVQTVRKD